MSGELVLVTGGSGFIGAHCVLHLLEQGYRVRTTVRSADREPQVRAMVEAGGVTPGDRLTFAHADLTADDGWAAAVDGCAFVQHVASPFPAKLPKHEDDLIVPAREGTLRVLRAATDAGVRRVVLTSSFAAIGYGHADPTRVFTEHDWTALDGTPLVPYVKSKVLAERAAWEYAERENLEIATVNPVAVFGPALGPGYSAWVEVIEQLLNGRFPALPDLDFNVVDVRDVADLHRRAMIDPAAAGERFLAITGRLPLTEVAGILRARLGTAAHRVPVRTLPDWVVRLAGRFDDRLAQITPDLGIIRTGSGDKARSLLGWSPRPVADTFTDTAVSLSAVGRLRTPITA
ncbi:MULTISPECIES: aldehyde reductase [Actinoplanes]|uniref:SDR family oxidoreductase n=1 Tax=Actinoplanes TaxID=1865 RepID=UPI0005F2B6EE|nr:MULTISPECIES: aldehyde reductase [Actinoplanes]GLY04430.1 dihydroflavonol-4-reductase [Actinoplanes sp. NBRC 101535]